MNHWQSAWIDGGGLQGLLCAKQSWCSVIQISSATFSLIVFKGEKHKNPRSQKNLAMFCVLLLVNVQSMYSKRKEAVFPHL